MGRERGGIVRRSGFGLPSRAPHRRITASEGTRGTTIPGPRRGCQQPAAPVRYFPSRHDTDLDAMPLKYFQTPVPGRVGGSTLIVLAIRGDAATDQLEVAEVHDVSLAGGDIPETATRRVVPAADFVGGPNRQCSSADSPLCTNGLSGTRSAPDATPSWSTLPTRECPEPTCVSADKGRALQSGIARAVSVGPRISRRSRRQPCA